MKTITIKPSKQQGKIAYAQSLYNGLYSVINPDPFGGKYIGEPLFYQSYNQEIEKSVLSSKKSILFLNTH